MAVLALTASLTAAFCQADDSFPVADFQVNYLISKSFLTAELTMRLKSLENGYEMNAVLEPRGLASFLISKEDKKGKFVWRDGRVVPVSYKAEIWRKTETLDFDWKNKNVRSDFEGNVKTSSLRAGVLDDASLWIQLLVDIDKNAPGPWDYQVFSRGKLREYRYRMDGFDQISTRMGEIDTIIVLREKNGKVDRKFWISPAHNYLPAKGQKLSGGEVDFEMSLQSWEIDSLNAQ